MTQTAAPAFTHSQDCDDQFIGRSARIERDVIILDMPGPAVDPLVLLDYVIAEAHRMQAELCVDCAKTALHRVEASLTTVRKREKALRNSPAFGSRDYSIVADLVDELVAKRAALRAELAH